MLQATFSQPSIRPAPPRAHPRHAQFYGALEPLAAPRSGMPSIQYSPQLRLACEEQLGAVWIEFDAAPRPTYNPELIRDFVNATRDLEDRPELYSLADGRPWPIEHMVSRSLTPGVFSLGGDLDLFQDIIRARDLEGLRIYARASVEPMARLARGFGRPIVSAALVQGRCLGGGFETALSHDFIIAERQSMFGFPEKLFNLFPGMGAATFICRKAGERVARELIESGKLFTAQEMFDRGLVDILVDEGQGVESTRKFIAGRRDRINSYAGISRAIGRTRGDIAQELFDIADDWARAAIQISDADLDTMAKLVARQDRLASRVAGQK